jgi:iron-sulfur cluster assembly protein
MLTVTDFAAAAIRHLLERSNASDEAGLRIARGLTTRRLRVGLVREPASGDTVIIAAAGVRVFLDESAASLLNGQILDGTLGVGGRVDFFTTEAREPAEPGR